MKYFRLIWSGLWRKPARTIFMLLSIVAAFMLFGLLQGVDSSIKQTIDRGRLNVLITANSGGLPLPLAYLPQIASIKGVTGVTYSSGFSAQYQSNVPVTVMAVDPEQYFSLFHDSATTSPAELAAFRRTRTGALVARGIARDNHWKLGQHLPLHASGTLKRDGTSDWTFDIVGYYDNPGDPEHDFGPLLMNYAYFDAARVIDPGTVQLYVESIADSSQARAISTAVDNRFTSSPAPTHTDTEKATAEALLAQLGDLDFFVGAILASAFATLLVLTSTTLTKSYHERISELAVLKTVGFSDAGVAGLLVSEAILLGLIAAPAGVLLAKLSFDGLTRAKVLIGVNLPGVLFLIAMAGAIVLALVSALPPAWQARRLSIVNALGKR
jgi:putative ABC transport system permease protein